ncbi:uncharacterized protein LOC111633999 isoform X3 [Centruroides sculpturatus]|uniref:uncharacterized protein LOC111633999 isoform X3 n=1 Tax=Centruroides sculpturatus TaxID=218467 RepID=UPI000C6D1C71|nr:uncharacterized protein LOC111633999 isoform X3 [Centruroides sculpturatus]
MAYVNKLLQLFFTLLVLGSVHCSNSKQFLESLLRQNNNNLVLTVSTNNTTKDVNTSSSMPSLSAHDTNQSSSYREFYRLFYGLQQTEEENDFQENDLSRAKKPKRIKNGKDLEDIRQANLHYLKIRDVARCRTPGSRVIRVKDYYPDPSKEYLPRCTVVYRCGDDSGCCDNDAFQCVPRFVQEVALPFYTLHVGKQGLKIGNTIEKLLFINHTQCECQPVNDQPRTEEGVSSDAKAKVHRNSIPLEKSRKDPDRERERQTHRTHDVILFSNNTWELTVASVQFLSIVENTQMGDARAIVSIAKDPV